MNNTLLTILISIISVMSAFLFFFARLMSRNIRDYIITEITKHEKDEKTHPEFIRRNEIILLEHKLMDKLNKINEEMANLREEFHIFKEKLSVKLSLKD